ncbi:MAG: DUF805 domain-containing protein [Hydrotalea sp.]|nr:DUF805 domain-containing protein [Hydrotalea sp.]
MINVLHSIFVKKYFTLTGRASRREYWTGQFVFWAIHAIAASISLSVYKAYFAPINPALAPDMGLRFLAACFIFSLPTYVWRHVGWLLLAAVAGFIALAIFPFATLWQMNIDFVNDAIRFISPVAASAIPVLLATLYLLPPSISVTVRRFHDRGLPGLTLLFIPEVVGFIIDLLSGAKKTNRYGEPPVV